jgi:signal transduction histidine kinase
VEDNQRLAKFVRQALGAAGIEADLFSGIETAWAAAQQPGYGLFVIDRGLPDGDGLVLVKRMRSAGMSEDRNYRVESTEVAAVAVKVVDYLRRLAERRHVYLDLCCTSAESKSVQADPAALHMLLKNVVENAIEHSPHGGVVAVMVESDQVTIRDEGPGIPEADLPHLFTRYWRGSTRQTEGAGLGLAICKEIVTAHHWHLSARNSGLGAEFVLRFAASVHSSESNHAPLTALPAVTN